MPPPRTGRGKVGLFRDPIKREKTLVQQLVKEMLPHLDQHCDPAQVFQKIITRFDPARPFGGTGLERNVDHMVGSADRIARTYKGSGRALRVLTTAYERAVESRASARITDAQREQTLATFPEGPAVEIEIPPIRDTLADSIHFEPEDIATIIQRMPDGKAQGPSGLSSTHLRAVAKAIPHFAAHLAKLGNQLLEAEDAIGRVPALYKYRIQYIPKGAETDPAKQRFRPICVQEVFLTVLHRHLARQLQRLVPVSDSQFCFRPSGRQKALRLARRMNDEGKTLLQLDVKNAFGSIPHAQIVKMLHERCPGPQVVAYIQRFLNARHCDELSDRIHRGVGVPQGDPMSMFLFALGVDPILVQIQAELGEISAYADDIVIGLRPDVTPQAAIQRATELYASIGLEIQPAKCSFTGGDREIDFLGHPFKMGDALTIAQHIEKTADRKLKVLTHFKTLRAVAAYVMLNRSVIPAVNYGPLVEMGGAAQARQKYQEIDQKLLETLSTVLRLAPYNLTPAQLEQFALARRSQGGLELMLPGAYFDVMQEHADALVEANPTERLKTEFFESLAYLDKRYARTSGPAVEAVLPYADLLKDDQLQALLDLRFGTAEEEVCQQCHKRGTHLATCPGYMDQVWGTHNGVLRAILHEMLGRRKAETYQAEVHGPAGRHFADG